MTHRDQSIQPVSYGTFQDGVISPGITRSTHPATVEGLTDAFKYNLLPQELETPM